MAQPVEQGENSVRVVRTFLVICLCVVNRYVSLCYGHIYNGILFDFWYVVPTLYVFLGVFLGCATTLGVKMG